MTELILAVAGALLLHIFFRAVEVRWPETYYGLSDLVSYQLSLRLRSYLVFRFLPVVVVGFIVCVVADLLGRRSLLPAISAAVIHGLFTAGRASVNAANRPGTFGRRLLLVAHLGVFVLVVIAGVVGGLLGQIETLHVLLPDLDAMKSDLWTALLAGVFGAYLARVALKTEIDPQVFVRQSQKRIEPELLAHANETAVQQGADPDLVLAIMLVENMQRPSWIRKLERAAGRWLPIGSYGVMQVQSDGPISDIESIDLAVASKLAGAMVTDTADAREKYLALQRTLRGYNANPRFMELVEQTYDVLKSDR